MMRRAVITLALVASACTATSTESSRSAPSTTAATTAVDGESASGILQVPAAGAFGEPGFHEVVAATGAFEHPVEAGQTLVVRLRDAGRQGQECDSDHPLSGCLTIDWSDFDDRPDVPPGGVFDNHIVVSTATGPRTYFLSETGVLAAEPDPYSPG